MKDFLKNENLNALEILKFAKYVGIEEDERLKHLWNIANKQLNIKPSEKDKIIQFNSYLVFLNIYQNKLDSTYQHLISDLIIPFNKRVNALIEFNSFWIHYNQQLEFGKIQKMIDSIQDDCFLKWDIGNVNNDIEYVIWACTTHLILTNHSYFKYNQLDYKTIPTQQWYIDVNKIFLNSQNINTRYVIAYLLFIFVMYDKANDVLKQMLKNKGIKLIKDTQIIIKPTDENINEFCAYMLYFQIKFEVVINVPNYHTNFELFQNITNYNVEISTIFKDDLVLNETKLKMLTPELIQKYLNDTINVIDLKEWVKKVYLKNVALNMHAAGIQAVPQNAKDAKKNFINYIESLFAERQRR